MEEEGILMHGCVATFLMAFTNLTDGWTFCRLLAIS